MRIGTVGAHQDDMKVNTRHAEGFRAVPSWPRLKASGLLP